MLATDMSHRLSDHFTLAEACRSQLAVRNGIVNRPAIELVPKMEFVARRVLEPARAHYGVPFAPNSFFRCQALERALKPRAVARAIESGRVARAADWMSNSQHVKGEAVDFEIPGVPNLALATWAAAKLAYDQLILECWDPDDPAAGWLHVSYVSPAANRKQVLTFDGRRYHKGLPGAGAR